MLLTSPNAVGTPAFRVYPNDDAQAAGTGEVLCSAHTREFRSANPDSPRAAAQYGQGCNRCITP